MNTIQINNQNVLVKQYKGQRVVTFKDIDTVHNRTDGTAGRNFRTNRIHFIEGEDFFKISPDEFRRAIAPMDKRQTNDITLITESGYLMLVKSFTDDLSWNVQRQLVKSYFRCNDIETEFYNYVDKSFDEAFLAQTGQIIPSNNMHSLMGHIQRDVAEIQYYSSLLLTTDKKAKHEEYRKRLVIAIKHIRAHTFDIDTIKI